jgi:hypothetical protein
VIFSSSLDRKVNKWLNSTLPYTRHICIKNLFFINEKLMRFISGEYRYWSVVIVVGELRYVLAFIVVLFYLYVHIFDSIILLLYFKYDLTHFIVLLVLALSELLCFKQTTFCKI